jgi:PAS domain S-box-containing protein
MLGYLPENFKHYSDFVKLVHPEDHNRAMDAMKRHLDGLVDKYEVEYRILDYSGEYKWFYDIGSIIKKDAKGIPQKVAGLVIDITNRKLTEEKLWESEHKFQKIYQNGPFGMAIIGSDFRFVSVNPTLTVMLGYTEQELQKFTFKDVTHPDDLDVGISDIYKLIKKEISILHTEKRYIRKDGRFFWAELTVTSNFDNRGQFLYNLSIVQDISVRKQAEADRFESEERYRAAFTTSPDSININTMEGKFVDVNEGFTRLSGYTREEVTGKFSLQIQIWSDPNDRIALIKHLEKSGSVSNLEFTFRHKDGSTRDCLMSACIIALNNVPHILSVTRDITAVKQAEKKIREKDIQFRKLSANVHDLIFQFTRRPDGTYFVPIASEGIRNIFGCSPEDVLDDFTPIGRVIYPEDSERVISDIEYSAKHMTYFTCEFRVQIPGRPIQWIYSKSTPEKLADGSITWYGFYADITKNKIAELEIIRLNERISTATHAAHLGIWDWDIVNNRLEWDDQMYHLYGVTKNQFSVVYQTWLNGIYPDDRARCDEETNQALTGGFIYDTEFRVLWPDGSIHYLKADGDVFLNKQGEPVRMVGVNYDITLRKNSESEIKQLNETLERRVLDRTAQLETANQEMEAFAYSVSHDLQAPLRHIKGFMNLFLDTITVQLSENEIKYLSKISASVNEMGDLIDALLSFFRLATSEVTRSKIDSGNMVHHVLRGFKEEISSRNIAVTIGALPDIVGDNILIRQVWINLISNAVKYTAKKANASIQIGSLIYDDETVFYVKDNGAGFNMKYASKLFGVFQRLHKPRDFEGIGIGLATVGRIVSRHHGRYWAEGEVGQGAAFYFSIPGLPFKSE